MASDDRYWFPAKRYGWGWGRPSTWQGWLVLAVFMVPIAACIVIFPPNRALASYLVCVTILSVTLIVIAWFKGEPPRRRWGDGDK